jgi:hypothetical protein
VVAGILDALTAFYLYGWSMPRGIASGLLGRSALGGGTPTWILGLALHFFIAISAAAVYYAASRKLKFLAESPVVCGLFYGIAVFLVMNLIVLPFSAIHFRDRFNPWPRPRHPDSHVLDRVADRIERAPYAS